MYCFYFCHVFGMKIIFFYENEITFLFQYYFAKKQS